MFDNLLEYYQVEDGDIVLTNNNIYYDDNNSKIRIRESGRWVLTFYIYDASTKKLISLNEWFYFSEDFFDYENNKLDVDDKLDFLIENFNRYFNNEYQPPFNITDKFDYRNLFYEFFKQGGFWEEKCGKTPFF